MSNTNQVAQATKETIKCTCEWCGETEYLNPTEFRKMYGYSIPDPYYHEDCYWEATEEQNKLDLNNRGK